MSRMHDNIHIRSARNGFMVSPSAAYDQTVVDIPYVFESFGSLVKWLEINYVDGNQPGSED